MTIQQLRYFIATAQYLHFGEAAKACYISQPSLSKSILELEKELDLKLLKRDNRSVELTPAGKVFYQEAQEIVARLDDAVLKAKKANAGYVGVLRIGTLGGLSSGQFPSRIEKFLKQNPEISVELVQTNMKTLNIQILTGKLDVALTRELDVLPRSDEISWKTLYQDHFGIVLRKDSPLVKKGVDYGTLGNEKFIFLDPLVTPHVYSYTIRLCASRGFVPNIIQTAPTLEIACTMIKAGLGIGVLPDCALAYSYGTLRFVPMEGEDAVSNVVLAWKKSNENPVLPVFLQDFGIDILTADAGSRADKN